MKKAFTLAEVLITLGIIGIVAAMTLPAVVAKYKRQEATARLKKFNSMMAQVVILSQNDNGAISSWDTSMVPEDFVRKYFAPYLKHLKIDSYGGDDGKHYGRMYFADGSSVRVNKGDCMDFHFDTNGDKKPNKTGFDQFVFLACDTTASVWCTQKGWCTYHKASITTREQAYQECKQNAMYCSVLLEYDNWEFKEDYPYNF